MAAQDLTALFGAESLFGGGEVKEADRDMLERIIRAGVYGHHDTYTERLIEAFGGSRARYVLAKIFPPFSKVKYMNPTVWKHKYLYPLFVIRRLIKAATVKRRKVLSELKEILRKG